MDKTSEIDFVVNSYIMEKYSQLSDSQKEEFRDLLNEKIDDNKSEKCLRQNELDKELLKQDLNMKNIIFAARDALSHEARFELFDFLTNIFVPDESRTHSLESYKEINAVRNKFAHKKLDISACQKYIMYCDTVRQYLAKRCPSDCELHSDNDKISLEEWQELIKSANDYVKWFNKLFKDLLDEKQPQGQS